jgi:multicomponent Na+:H+ antiporter subunit G
MIGEILQYAGGVLLILGALAGALGALGLLRFPDLYTRLHAASLGAIGLCLCFLALALTAADLAVALRAILGLTFVLLTSPVIAHLLARSARKAGVLSSREASTPQTGKIPQSK